MGIEPTSEAWEASILPLNYARSDGERDDSTTTGKGRKRRYESDARSRYFRPRLARLAEISSRAFDLVVIDMGVVNAAEWAPVLSAPETILLVAEPTSLALGMIHRHVAGLLGGAGAGSAARPFAKAEA